MNFYNDDIPFEFEPVTEPPFNDGDPEGSPFDINVHKFPVTCFPDSQAKVKLFELATLPELADLIRVWTETNKKALPWLKLGSFGAKASRKNCLRTNENMLTISGVEGDADNGKMALDEAGMRMRAANIRCLLATSASHVPVVKERWRILVPLSQEYPPAKRLELVAIVNGILDGVLAAESFVMSLSYYFGSVDNNPHHRVVVLDGRFLDLVADEFRAGALTKQGKPALKKNTKGQSGNEGQTTPGRTDEEIMRLISSSCELNSQGEKQWHNSMRDAIASAVMKRWTDNEIFDATAEYCWAGWGDPDVEELIDSARVKFDMPEPVKDWSKTPLGTFLRKMIADRSGGASCKPETAPEAEASPDPEAAQVTATATAETTSIVPDWREQTAKGWPKASFHNACLAIITTGTECAYDAFHNKLLIGWKDEAKVEVSDHLLIMLRKHLSNTYDFDLTEQHIRDAVTVLALEHRFNPVADMLAQAEANWDGVLRLDRMAVDYFNCADTAFNRAAIRKTMIAGVARVRRPGCKFDTVPVLESDEGWNKSTAWRVLAGDENYSDESIIGKASREVQEGLGGVWIHENAELAGMRKAEIESVKSYASRQVDRARPAYGHCREDHPRHSVETATTNADTYLLSQTGNRRFWPLKVLARIDIEKLNRDRLQLWGEAAHYQSQGEALTLDESLWPDAAAEQEKRRVKHLWEEVLAELPKMAKGSIMVSQPGDPVHRFKAIPLVHVVDGVKECVATRDILEHALKIPVANQINPSIGHTLRAVMRVLGWQRTDNRLVWIDGKQVAGYWRPLATTSPPDA